MWGPFRVYRISAEHGETKRFSNSQQNVPNKFHSNDACARACVSVCVTHRRFESIRWQKSSILIKFMTYFWLFYYFRKWTWNITIAFNMLWCVGNDFHLDSSGYMLSFACPLAHTRTRARAHGRQNMQNTISVQNTWTYGSCGYGIWLLYLKIDLCCVLCECQMFWVNYLVEAVSMYTFSWIFPNHLPSSCVVWWSSVLHNRWNCHMNTMWKDSTSLDITSATVRCLQLFDVDAIHLHRILRICKQT